MMVPMTLPPAPPTPNPTPIESVLPTPIPSGTVPASPLPVEFVSFDLGSLAEWSGAVVAVVAVIVGAIALRYNRKAVDASTQANELTAAAYAADVKERREAQARFVYATTAVPVVGGGPSRWYVSVTVNNNSTEIVGPFRLSLYDKVTGRQFGSQQSIIEDRPLLPGTSYTHTFQEPASGDDNPAWQPRAKLQFRDSSGQWWERRDYEPIELLSGAPLW
jgi:hypothetical protein